MTTNLAARSRNPRYPDCYLGTLWKTNVVLTMNGALAGLVAITASCDVVNDYEAIFIGAVAGVVVVFAVEFFDKVVKIDDPVGAISVHGVCGALGTLFTGIFGEGCNFITQLIGFVAVANLHPGSCFHPVLYSEKDHRSSCSKKKLTDWICMSMDAALTQTSTSTMTNKVV